MRVPGSPSVKMNTQPKKKKKVKKTGVVGKYSDIRRLSSTTIKPGLKVQYWDKVVKTKSICRAINSLNQIQRTY